MKFFATAARGLPPILAAELHQLGAQKILPGNTGVTFEGDLETAYRVCLWSRTASRVLLPLTTVKADTPEQLYAEAKMIRWEKQLHSSGSFAVDVRSSNANIQHSKYAALTLKDAVVDRFREQFDERPSVDLETPDIRIHLQLLRDRARISLDLSGSSLHRRGYRISNVTAPLKENLAAALLLESGWPGIARNGGALLDPMCGSGTLLIEGTLIAADIAPGLYRDYFGFLGWRRHEPETWERLRQEAKQRRDTGLASLPPIVGYDRDEEAVLATEDNIYHAMLQEHITVSQQDLEQTLPAAPAAYGLVATNPPYGERLGEVAALQPLYSRIGEAMRTTLHGWQLSMITANPELAAQLGMTGRKPTTFFNGPIECQLFRYNAVDETKPSGATAKTELTEGAQMFANRLRKNLKNLGKWAEREGITCYRVYDADLPEYALAVDLYRGEQLWAHVQEYQAPKSVDPDKAAHRLQEALSALPQVLDIPREQIFFKVRRKQKGTTQYEKLGDSRRFHEVREGSCRLLVNFSDYLDTGLFLDHRPTRQLLEERARDKRFLNLFAYTGSATVHAAMGGARATTTVDMSNTYLEWARRNMALNGFRGNQHHYVQADCTTWLEQEAQRPNPQRYDLIFLDPPTFSSSKRMEESFDIQRDHVALLRNAMALLEDDGLLVFSNNFRRFKLEQEALSDLQIEEISSKTLPRDFARNPHIHRCWLIRKN
jgi:23S rRNA (guanine2445-N2)-methyltransferase / 23S rRNA (guanine2069-N7)-methyltransferase